MFQAIGDYVARISEDIGEGWNRFWYTPTHPLPLSTLRVLAGLLAFYYLGSYSFDLVEWFGPRGLLPIQTAPEVLREADGIERFHPSLLNLAHSSRDLWLMHALGLATVLLLTLGLFTRITCVLSLVFVLSYMHRAPMLIGQMEPVLAMALLYLCLGPAGACLSLDRLRRKRKDPAVAFSEPRPSWTANLSLRLLQVHVTGLYLLVGLSQLGVGIWQDGTAVWWMASLSESRLIDATGLLAGNTYLYNLLTHAVTAFEVCFGILIWNRTARPLLLVLSVIMWGMLALLSGLVGYCLLMLALGIVFVPAEVIGRVVAPRQSALASGAEATAKAGSFRVSCG